MANMQNFFFFGTLAILVAVDVGCFSDDPPTNGQQGGPAGAGGMSGRGGGGASLGGAGTGGGGAGGAAGTIDGGIGGMGGTAVDSCQGKYNPLPFPVSSAFTTLRICSGGTCDAPAMPYFFSPIANPNCDEAFPDGGIVPPFADAGMDDAAGGDDALGPGGDDAAVLADEAGGSELDAAAGGDAGDVSVTGPVADARADAAPPACYEFAYNPACTTGVCWGGVVFTQSAGGISDPGICIEPGAA